MKIAQPITAGASILLLLAACAVAGFAQESRGTILGRVVDNAGAVMPGVEVKAANVSTNVTAVVVTNSAGSYNIPFLPPGSYRVTAEITGFKKFVRDGVEVSVSESVEVNIAMQVGAVTESVETRADTAQLDTTGPSRGKLSATSGA